MELDQGCYVNYVEQGRFPQRVLVFVTTWQKYQQICHIGKDKYEDCKIFV